MPFDHEAALFASGVSDLESSSSDNNHTVAPCLLFNESGTSPELIHSILHT